MRLILPDADKQSMEEAFDNSRRAFMHNAEKGWFKAWADFEEHVKNHSTEKKTFSVTLEVMTYEPTIEDGKAEIKVDVGSKTAEVSSQ